ncbi:hypothetical protein MJO28_011976 [Puccinia striiformis f. sp. tritici]|uniref:Uncharacterized protein n=1 Tax=Puccinia striiformis f. sp. tritici TaxID=168172 RepID=A0ACC0DYN3_9BASI|nr:hypothetical protein MJO28_011976 [Puccinia striiformis f. sp. tritici]
MVKHRRHVPNGKKFFNADNLSGCTIIIGRYYLCWKSRRQLSFQYPKRETLVTNTDNDYFIFTIQCPV